ncbi:alpha/beta hydrolase [Pseudoalteromonas sp. MMG006]|uniref:alpha/beta fold hydrolase n=1 Tax=Pseudoalteromonas sp. MMG006 TaxID=2822683 RepID=UPI001B35E8B0|nr:alpha/beta hydrolase [Pseudoalteromonas sp. MMG006]MBQ4800431.1 alpha/beta hydrolase [Pseudoalteromonas sp. MMG006]
MSKTQFVSVEGHHIAYQEVGEGTPLLLLHGIPTNKYLWRNIIPELAKSHKVIAPDLLNYGESDMPEDTDVSINAQCRIITKFMDSLGITKAHIAAHDIGGGIAQLIALNHPEKVNGLILIDSICFDSWPIPEFEPLLEPGIEEKTTVDEFVNTLQDFMPKGVYDKSIMTDELKKVYLEQWSNEQGKAALFANMRRLNKEYTQAIAGELKSLPHETLILWGEEDNFQKPKYAPMLEQTIPNSSLIWLEKTGHWCLDEQPEKIALLIGDFLKGKTF